MEVEMRIKEYGLDEDMLMIGAYLHNTFVSI